jgi:elongation factor G
VTDFDEEEIARKHTLSASLAYAEWNKVKINFIDTPGIASFFADARAGLRVADAALLCRGRGLGRAGADGKDVAGRRGAGLPRLVVVNRMDRERASLERTLHRFAPR